MATLIIDLSQSSKSRDFLNMHVIIDIIQFGFLKDNDCGQLWS